jgi:hypothetical protein
MAVTILGSGQVPVKVIQTVKSDTFSVSLAQGASSAITGLTASITPSSASNKILVTWTINSSCSLSGGESDGTIQLTRNSTAIGIGDASSSRPRVTQFASATADANRMIVLSGSFLDSPNTTSSTTYGMNFFNGWGGTFTWYLNRSPSDADSTLGRRTISTITLMEISG